MKGEDFRQEEKIKRQDLKMSCEMESIWPWAHMSAGDDSTPLESGEFCVSTDAFCFPRRNQ